MKKTVSIILKPILRQATKQILKCNYICFYILVIGWRTNVFYWIQNKLLLLLLLLSLSSSCLIFLALCPPYVGFIAGLQIFCFCLAFTFPSHSTKPVTLIYSTYTYNIFYDYFSLHTKAHMLYIILYTFFRP